MILSYLKLGSWNSRAQVFPLRACFAKLPSSQGGKFINYTRAKHLHARHSDVYQEIQGNIQIPKELNLSRKHTRRYTTTMP